MSNYETKPGNGAIFKNEKKEKETHPDFNGKGVDPSGKEWDFAMWKKVSASGKPYFSLSIKEPYKKDFVDATVEAARSKNPLVNDEDDLFDF